MTGIEYTLVACGFVVLAIVVNLVTRFDAEAWIARGLKRGDLYALIDVASGLRVTPTTPRGRKRIWWVENFSMSREQPAR
jgi:hypothetical protein